MTHNQTLIYNHLNKCNKCSDWAMLYIHFVRTDVMTVESLESSLNDMVESGILTMTQTHVFYINDPVEIVRAKNDGRSEHSI